MVSTGMKKTALWLTIIGGLNWGLIGLFNFNLVQTLLGSIPLVEKIVYIAVGLSAVCVAMDAAKK
ncbi:MAG: DUF378 domain-containing protein [Nanoarchaeota archaeon]|nr:DUF378 domain-containing protein [Nanoarchaeota archaeon]